MDWLQLLMLCRTHIHVGKACVGERVFSLLFWLVFFIFIYWRRLILKELFVTASCLWLL